MRPGISLETLARAGVRSVTADEAKALCNLSEAGLFLPYHTLDGVPALDNGKPYGRLRLANAKAAKKYHQAFGSSVHAYVPPSLKECAPGNDLFIIEGEFKSLALTESGFPAVGVSGFFGFAEPGGDKFVTELADVLDHLRPARVFFCGDSDTALNYQFSVAAVRLATLLNGTPVLLPRIPLNGPGKGADDCRAALGGSFADWWRERMSAAVSVHAKAKPGSLACELLSHEADAVALLDSEAREKAERRIVEMAAMLERDPLAQEKVIVFAVEHLRVKRAPFKRAVAVARQEMRMQAAQGAGRAVNMGSANGLWCREVFEVIGAEVYFYAQNVCRMCEGELVPQSAAEICSFIDEPARVVPFRLNAKGEQCPVRFTESDARILLGAWQDSLYLLRVVDVKSNVPVLAWDGNAPVLVNGYCLNTRILAGGEPLELPTCEQAVAALCELLRDYDFTSPGDMGRAMSFVFTPALTQGGFLGAGRAPLFLIEKNEASAGGSLLVKLISRIYGQPPKPITQLDDPKRLYEDVSAKLLAGDGICYFDNARGNGLQRLPWFESLLTEPTFACRMPYKQGEADVTRRVFAVSTNGALLSDDLTTRTVKISITKRPDDYAWHPWPEGGIEEHVIANRSRYLGAVYALVNDWALAGRPAGRTVSNFRFHQWEKACAWILEKHFAGLPLLDAEHKEAQKRLADPDHDLLRNLLRIVLDGENRAELTASSFAEIGVSAGLLQGSEEQNKFRIGKALKRRFPHDGEHSFDGGRLRITRQTRESASGRDVSYYTIHREDQP